MAVLQARKQAAPQHGGAQPLSHLQPTAQSSSPLFSSSKPHVPSQSQPTKLSSTMNGSSRPERESRGVGDANPLASVSMAGLQRDEPCTTRPGPQSRGRDEAYLANLAAGLQGRDPGQGGAHIGVMGPALDNSREANHSQPAPRCALIFDAPSCLHLRHTCSLSGSNAGHVPMDHALDHGHKLRFRL